MPITITISHEFAGGALQELRELSAGLLGAGPQLYAGPYEPAAQAVEHDQSANAPAAAPEPEAPKRTRRTKAQIEADEAAAKAAAQPTPLEAAISATPEDRTNPDDAVAETAEEETDGIEDMADGPVPGVELTLEQKRDTLRHVAGLIAVKFDNDLVKAQAACVGVFKANGVGSISTCPDDKIAVIHAAMSAIANG